ncbi:MAG: OmpA family protein [Gemmatimonadaceae bacterium]
MTRLSHLAPFAAAAVLILSLDACRRQQVPAPGASTTTSVDTSFRQGSVRDSIAAAERIRQQAIDDSLRAARAATAREADALRNTLREVIHFDFDESDLRDDARSRLDAKLPILLANPGIQLRISGHADERGSDEYNLALGQRRAAAAKRYLTQRGVAEGRIETASFGEEQPVAASGDEASHAANRRAEFEITGGGDRLVRPRS